MRDDYLKQAQKVIPDPNILINVISRRCRQIRYGGMVPLVESLEKLEPEDAALLEIINHKISYRLYNNKEQDWVDEGSRVER